jgi:hypothetical protein
MSRLYGITALPTVVAVAPGSPAEKAGVKPRDVVLSVWGLPTSGQDGKAIRERSRTAKAGEAMPVQIRRNDEVINLTMEPVLACDYAASLSPEQVLNAYADGDRIFITRGMMAFARTDDELALVLGHEMAHNTMEHAFSQRVNATLGTVADVALNVLTRGIYNMSLLSSLASQAHSQEFEAEADYVGLYMLANSGYSIEDAPKFWRRMAVASPASIKGSHTASHPPTSYRMVALEEAAKEIEGKRLAMAALVPARKDGKPFVPGNGLLVAAVPSLPSALVGVDKGATALSAQGGNTGATSAVAASTVAAREVVGCVPVGTRAGERISLRDWGVVDVRSISKGSEGCGPTGATPDGVNATFVQVGGITQEQFEERQKGSLAGQ